VAGDEHHRNATTVEADEPASPESRSLLLGTARQEFSFLALQTNDFLPKRIPLGQVVHALLGQFLTVTQQS
jgi:hypothetical protein